MPNQNNQFLLILRSDWFVESFASYCFDKQFNDIRKILNEKKFTVKNTDISYRAINSWSDAGLLFEDKNREMGWRKFSYTDLAWILIIRELRNFGFAAQKIKTLKTSLFYLKEKQREETSIFEFYLAAALNRHDVTVVVTQSGEGAIARETEYQASQIVSPLPTSHLLISLNKICAEITKKPNLAKKNEHLFPLNSKEIEFFDRLIADDSLNEIVIKPKDGKINRIHFKQKIENPKAIISCVKKALADGGYKDITIKVHKGHAASFEVTDKQ